MSFCLLREDGDTLQLIAQREARCFAILETCKVEPQTVADLVPVIFGRPIDPHQLVFAFARRSPM